LTFRRSELLENGGLGGFVVDIRGAGVFWAIEVACPGQETFAPRLAHRMQALSLENGISTLGMPALRMDGGGDCLMLAPPAICTPAQAKKICDLAILTVKQIREQLVAEGHLSPL
jgi:adenosylmethionine-8-amino-7-oxononanoate aminotransferase